MRRWFLVTAATGLLLSSAGCHGRLFRRPCKDDCPPGESGGAGRGGGRLELGEPVPGSNSRLPPAGVPTDDFPAPRVPESRNYLDPFGPEGRRYQPSTPRRLPPADVPLALTDSPPTPGGLTKWLDEPIPPSGLALPSRDTGPRTDGGLPPRDSRPSLKPVAPSPARPLGEAVPGRDGVTSGGAIPPSGYAKLRDAGVRGVVYLHDPAVPPDDLAAARAQAEAAGLRFTPVSVSPETLRDALTTFTRAVTDAAAKPVHVTDDSGVRAGCLWYLVFRTAEQRPDEVARLRATPLGLPDPASEAGRRYWPAILEAVR